MLELIDWTKVYKLSPGEFSEDPDKYADPLLIYSLSNTRKKTKSRMFPSPIRGALARHDGRKSSQHYVGDKKGPVRMSTACDVFCEGVPFANYTTILESGLYRGVGIYLDTNGPDGKPWVMFHLDIRTKGYYNSLSTPLIWIVEKEMKEDDSWEDIYKFPQTDPKLWSLLNTDIFFINKRKGVYRA